MRHILEKSLERLRELLEVTGTRDEMRAESEDFTSGLIDELLAQKELSENE